MSLSPSRFLSRFANRLVNHRWCAVENAWTFDLRRSTKDFSPAPCGKLFKIAGTSAARSRAPRRCLIIVVSRVRGDDDFVTAYTSVNSRKMTFVRQDEGGEDEWRPNEWGFINVSVHCEARGVGGIEEKDLDTTVRDCR